MAKAIRSGLRFRFLRYGLYIVGAECDTFHSAKGWCSVNILNLIVIGAVIAITWVLFD